MPAAILKSSLRSSLRHNPPLPAEHRSYSPRSPPSIGDSTTSMHLGKRSRPTRNGEGQISKRQKINDLQPSYPRKVPVRDHQPDNHRKQPRADRAAGLSGASRTTSAVQPPSNGTIIAPHSHLTNGDTQPLTIDTSSSTKPGRNAEKDKRTLRSHDGGSRSKSELAQYFPNFDDIVSNEPKEVGALTLIHCLNFKS